MQADRPPHRFAVLFGPSGSGKSHLSAAFGHALIENGYRVLFTRTTDLVQRLQQARQRRSKTLRGLA
jgi:DNA replication protein DnaC